MYRFRPIENLLEKYNELENQEIYFASPEELNDPIEGFRDIYWKGDSIIWKNLLKQYLRCLEHIFSLVLILGEDKKLYWKDIPIHINSLKFPTKEYKAIFDEILNVFFKSKFFKNLPNDLAKRTNPVRRDELLSYFKLVHPFAIETISEVYRNYQLLPKQTKRKDHLDEFKKILERAGSIVLLTNKLEKEPSVKDKKNIAEIFFSITNMVGSEVQLINQYENSEIELNSNRYFLLSDFPEQFLQSLESMIYPNWFSASFMSECTNSSVWGHYGQNHKGVCLIFEADKKGDIESLELDTENGYSSGSGATKAMVPHKFHKIRYENKHVEIDFFKSLARAPKYQLMAQWYTDEFGNKSICGEHLDNNIDEWRNAYWEKFIDSLIVKLDDWKYENEYRLIINDNFIDFNSIEKRKLKYDFSSLKGIIFGIKTSNADKIKILRIIEKKCKENSRKEFEFYQAYYSKENGKIETKRLNLMQFE